MRDDRSNQLPRSDGAIEDVGDAAGRGYVRRRRFAGPQTVEAYLRANTPPRYMQRLREIELEYKHHRLALLDAHRELAERIGDDDAFAAGWRARAREWSFDSLNALVREHNEWYPAEANLPMDPRTGDYVSVHGASYRRLELDAGWILAHLHPSRGDRRGALPRRAPREPGARLPRGGRSRR